jgi:hypothetical protein
LKAFLAMDEMVFRLRNLPDRDGKRRENRQRGRKSV